MPARSLRVRWLRTALANLEEHAQYIARDNPVAARRMVAAIERSVALLARYPALGRPGRLEGTRELDVPGTPYIVPYRVRGETVEILRVFHEARKWPSTL
ncbi:MAG: type II toxin-antitoxin system RelE/ParE family toxin [Terriglobales bacterium]